METIDTTKAYAILQDKSASLRLKNFVQSMLERDIVDVCNDVEAIQSLIKKG